MATLRLSRGQNQARLNYAEAKQGRPKVNLTTVIARLGTSRGNLIPSTEAEQGRPKVNLPLRSVILSVTKDLLRDYPF